MAVASCLVIGQLVYDEILQTSQVHEPLHRAVWLCLALGLLVVDALMVLALTATVLREGLEHRLAGHLHTPELTALPSIASLTTDRGEPDLERKSELLARYYRFCGHAVAPHRLYLRAVMAVWPACIRLFHLPGLPHPVLSIVLPVTRQFYDQFKDGRRHDLSLSGDDLVQGASEYVLIQTTLFPVHLLTQHAFDLLVAHLILHVRETAGRWVANSTVFLEGTTVLEKQLAHDYGFREVGRSRDDFPVYALDMHAALRQAQGDVARLTAETIVNANPSPIGDPATERLY